MKSIDLGSGFSYRFTRWSPDREILENQRLFDDVPDVEKCGIILTCPHGDGAVHFIIPGHRIFQDGWTVKQWEPLTISPSILRTECGCHGYIREGKWVPA